MVFEDYTFFDSLRSAIAVFIGIFSIFFAIGIWSNADPGGKMMAAGLAFVALGVALTLQSAVANEVQIRKLVERK
jgi:hypothetical protein